MARKDALQRLQKKLLKQRDHLRAQLRGQRRRLNHHDEVGDLGDVSVESVEHEIDSQLTALEANELRKIEGALAALKAGVYGTCVGCEKSIPVARLNAIPHATMCMRCQREQESGTVSGRLTPRDWSRAFGPVAGPDPSQTSMKELDVQVR